MAVLPHHLVFMVTAHLTETETQLLHQTVPVRFRHFQWNEVFLSESLCLYAIKHTIKHTSDFLSAVIKTVSCEVLVLPTITALFQQHAEFSKIILNRVIQTHRPIPFLAYLFQLYNCSRHKQFAGDFCDFAATANNIEVLEWLRDPTTGDGSYPWGKSACITAATKGHLAALVWLRNPKVGGGACPWNKSQCLLCAQYYNYPAIAAWIETQPDDDDA
jgi:hypothetical protein